MIIRIAIILLIVAIIIGIILIIRSDNDYEEIEEEKVDHSEEERQWNAAASALAQKIEEKDPYAFVALGSTAKLCNHQEEAKSLFKKAANMGNKVAIRMDIAGVLDYDLDYHDCLHMKSQELFANLCLLLAGYQGAYYGVDLLLGTLFMEPNVEGDRVQYYKRGLALLRYGATNIEKELMKETKFKNNESYGANKLIMRLVFALNHCGYKKGDLKDTYSDILDWIKTYDYEIDPEVKKNDEALIQWVVLSAYETFGADGASVSTIEPFDLDVNKLYHFVLTHYFPRDYEDHRDYEKIVEFYN